jgi:SAM-dependent methyltransferase
MHERTTPAGTGRAESEAPVRANDYDPIADLYDCYVRAHDDIPFFVRKVAAADGPVLELMAGTGRISTAIAPQAYHLTCVDRSTGMLRRLVGRNTGADAVCADVRALPFGPHFGLVLLPFQSFAEVTDPEDRERVLQEMNRVLRPNGRIIVSLHNPPVRSRSLDGVERVLGTFPLPAGGSLEVRSSATLDAGGLAVARQSYRVTDTDGVPAPARELVLRFVLLTRSEFEHLARQSGLVILELLGDYDGSRFDPDASPYMIWTLQRC